MWEDEPYVYTTRPTVYVEYSTYPNVVYVPNRRPIIVEQRRATPPPPPRQRATPPPPQRQPQRPMGGRRR